MHGHYKVTHSSMYRLSCEVKLACSLIYSLLYQQLVLAGHYNVHADLITACNVQTPSCEVMLACVRYTVEPPIEDPQKRTTSQENTLGWVLFRFLTSEKGTISLQGTQYMQSVLHLEVPLAGCCPREAVQMPVTSRPKYLTCCPCFLCGTVTVLWSVGRFD